MKELQKLLSNIQGYGSPDTPITVSTLQAIIIETIKQLEKENLNKG